MSFDFILILQSKNENFLFEYIFILVNLFKVEWNFFIGLYLVITFV